MFKIVICDDERITQQGLKQMIPWEEYHFTTIYTAISGVEALSLIRQHRPELVIIDIRVPRKDGVDLLDDIKDLDCQVIILPSCNDFEHMKAGIQHRVLDYLLKSVDHTQLKHVLGILVQRLLEHPHSINDDTVYYTTFRPLLKIDYDGCYVNQILS